MKMIESNSTKIYQRLIEAAHIKNHGDELLLTACEAGNKDAVEFLTGKGVNTYHPPEWSRSRHYRMTPYILAAVKSGSIDTVKSLLDLQCDIATKGFICLSKRMQNNVASNGIGCAAYHKQPKMLEFLLGKLPKEAINHRVIEKHDRFNSRMSTLYQKEFGNYTPLMLSIANCK